MNLDLNNPDTVIHAHAILTGDTPPEDTPPDLARRYLRTMMYKQAAVMADQFVDCMYEFFDEEELQDMRHGRAVPNDIIDANEYLLQIFVDEMGWDWTDFQDGSVHHSLGMDLMNLMQTIALLQV